MKVYLVGGAVRDQLLGYPHHEKDWVVVGASPDELLAQGFQQVGRDFPVFLHPKTKEEYALARLERKQAPGYHGFSCDFSKEVTLVDDLKRRDLTINAMALDEQQRLIDPYQGKKDLDNKILRHVSSAFAEDPVRVLRIARFAARYHYLGFKLASETQSLIYNMVLSKELESLVAERVWQEWQKSLSERNPEIFIQILRDCGALSIILPEIDALFGIPNPKQYHKEIDSGVHSLLVLQQAVILSESPEVRFAALLHDLGKTVTPQKIWPKHHRHEENGLKLIESLCARLRIPNDYRKLALLASKYHLTIHRFFELKASTIVRTLEETDAFRRPSLFMDLLRVAEADARGCLKPVDYKQALMWQDVLKLCSKITAKPFIEKGLKGEAIKNELHMARVDACKQFLNK
ncbi:MAG: multifunctional CCA addition/repair protein [Proteobacteria bacterium]|nr:multifunctional CCA addition/repair protein [Pseudomonadota bacterium]